MSGKGGAFRYVKPPKRLMEKVGTHGGVELADALVRADAAIAKVAEDFPEICEGWIKDLEDVLAKTDGELAPEMKERLLHVANDIRGQGGTFGYPLVTLVADSLVKFLDPRENVVPVEGAIVRLHIQALERLMHDRVVGDGGATGTELRTVMAALAKRRQKPVKPPVKPA